MPHSIAEFIGGGGCPSELASDLRQTLRELLDENGDITIGLLHEPYEDAAPLLRALAQPDPDTMPWYEQWELELACVPLLRVTIADMLDLERL